MPNTEMVVVNGRAVFNTWQKCTAPIIPRRTAEGKLKWTSSLGTTWRKRDPENPSRWIYRQEEETYEQWLARQW